MQAPKIRIFDTQEEAAESISSLSGVKEVEIKSVTSIRTKKHVIIADGKILHTDGKLR